MSDLIDRSELVKNLEMTIELMQALVKALNAEDDPEMKGELKAYSDILDGVKEMPSAQPDASDTNVDTINRQAAIEAASRGCFELRGIFQIIKQEIEAVPSAQHDAVEVVRCKDCKWKQGAECTRFAEVRPFPDDFCSRGERM